MDKLANAKYVVNARLELLRDRIYRLQTDIRDNKINSFAIAEDLEQLADQLTTIRNAAAVAANIEEDQINHEVAIGRIMHEQEKGHDGL